MDLTYIEKDSTSFIDLIEILEKRLDPLVQGTAEDKSYDSPKFLQAPPPSSLPQPPSSWVRTPTLEPFCLWMKSCMRREQEEMDGIKCRPRRKRQRKRRARDNRHQELSAAKIRVNEWKLVIDEFKLGNTHVELSHLSVQDKN